MKIVNYFARTFIFLFFLNLNAQDAPTMFWVHQDNVHFNKMNDFEDVAKRLISHCKTHKIDAQWTAIADNNSTYYFVTPISGMADLDKDPFALLNEKVGNDEMSKLWNDFSPCYDSHRDYIVNHIPALSYQPKVMTSDIKNYREYHFVYFTPENQGKMWEAFQNVKKLYESKNSNVGYDVYRSGFGSDRDYFMVSISGNNPLAIAQAGVANQDVLGKEREDIMYNMIILATDYEKKEANIRPELSYWPESND